MMKDWETLEGQAFLAWWRALPDDERKKVQKEVLARARAGSADFKQQVRLNIWRRITGKQEVPVVVHEISVKSKIDEVVMDVNCPP